MPKPPLIQNEVLQQITDFSSLVDEQGTFPQKAFDILLAEGLLQIVLPGQRLDFNRPDTPSLLDLLKQIGSADLSVGRIFEGHINALYLIHLFGSNTQKQEWYQDVSVFKKNFGVWNTQADDGIRIRSIADEHYVLEGCKTFCSGAGWISRPLITGELCIEGKSGWQMCIVPVERVNTIQQDSSFWKPMGMKGSVSYKMDFTGIAIKEKDLLGNPGSYYSQPVFSGGSIRFAAVQLGGAEAILNEVVSYLNSLNRTNDPFQRARVAEMGRLVTSGQQWLRQAGTNTDAWMKNQEDSEKIVAYANMTRSAIEEICTRTMQLAGECIGARGLMWPNPVERIIRDLTFYLRQPAPDATITATGEYILTKNAPFNELWL